MLNNLPSVSTELFTRVLLEHMKTMIETGNNPAKEIYNWTVNEKNKANPNFLYSGIAGTILKFAEGGSNPAELAHFAAIILKVINAALEQNKTDNPYLPNFDANRN